MRKALQRGRVTHRVHQWQEVADAVELHREGYENEGSRDLLIDYDLWDFSNETLDEESVEEFL